MMLTRVDELLVLNGESLGLLDLLLQIGNLAYTSVHALLIYLHIDKIYARYRNLGRRQ